MDIPGKQRRPSLTRDDYLARSLGGRSSSRDDTSDTPEDNGHRREPSLAASFLSNFCPHVDTDDEEEEDDELSVTNAATSVQYKLLTVLGRGTHGLVWRASRMTDGKVVAVKLYYHALCPTLLDTWRSLQHPYIVPVLDSFSTPRYPTVVVMPMATGNARNPNVHPMTLLKHVAPALRLLHDLDLAHRDVKPENILFVEGKLCLADLDFVSKVSEREERVVVGSLPYVPMEDGGDMRAQDMWALGVVAYELATGGRHPLPHIGTLVTGTYAISVPTTREIDYGCIADAELRSLLRGLLAKDPATRWTARQLCDYLAHTK